MSQSNSIGFALALGFVVYITVRGELPAYLCVVGIGSNCPNPPATPVSTSQNAPPSSTTIINNYPSAPSNPVASNPGVYTTINNPPVTVGNPIDITPPTIQPVAVCGGSGQDACQSTITYPPDNGGGSPVPCDEYGDTDPYICAQYDGYQTPPDLQS